MRIACYSRSARNHLELNVKPALKQECDIIDNGFLPDWADIVYFLGWYVDSPNWEQEHFSKIPDGKPAVIHWVGSDIEMCKRYNNIKMIEYLNSARFKHWAETPRTAEEVKQLGIGEVEVVPLPSGEIYDLTPLPEEFAVSVYYQPTHGNFIYDNIFKCAQERPDIKFKFHSLLGYKPQLNLPNVEELGRVENWSAFLDSVSCAVRFTTHDGMPIGLMQHLMKGRRGITNHSLPYVIHQLPSAKLLSSTLDLLKVEKRPYKEASDYYRDLSNHEKFKGEFTKLL